MRELERPSDISSARGSISQSGGAVACRVAIVGRGRLGTALSRALRDCRIDASDPLGRGADASAFDAVLLCVPDAEIAAAAAGVDLGPLVGHCSGATTLDVLVPHERFSLHPLMTITAADGAQRFAGAGAAVAGSTPQARAFARRLAGALAMRPFELADRDRAAYHAAAAIASNFLVTLQGAAERLLVDTGASREVLVPLVRATVENWAQLGPELALTGPVARGDEPTVAAQRAAVAQRAPDLLPVFDSLVEATRELASTSSRARELAGANGAGADHTAAGT